MTNLQEADNGEDVGESKVREDGEADPGSHFEGIVGAGDQLEEEAPGDGPGGAALRRPHVAQHQVADQITDLAHHEDCETDVHLNVSRRRELRVAERIADDGSERPVVDAVLEEVGQRHGGARKLVHKNCLQLSINSKREMNNDLEVSYYSIHIHLPFYEVHIPTDYSKKSNPVELCRTCRFTKDKLRPQSEEGHKDNWAEVLK